jgi:tripartite-type tricarboxylate transporter receptor subunit TctC
MKLPIVFFREETMRTILNSTLACAAVLAAFCAGAATAQTPEEFYAGKTVTVVSPSGVGGSIYQYALLVSNHLGKHIPGSPTTIVEERSGGGGVRAANYVFNAAPQDGTVVAELHPSSLIVPLTRDEGYDFSDAHWLGSVAVRPYVGAVWHTIAPNALGEIPADDPVIFASSGTGGSSYQYPVFVAKATGANLKVIPGYRSGGEMNLAMERGEVHGRGNYYEGFLATNPDWIADNKVKFLFRMGDAHPDLMDVPAVADMVDNEEDRALLTLLEAPLLVGQAFYVAPGVPEDRADALRQAFVDMLNDPEFIAESEALNLVVRTKTGAQVRAALEDVFATPPDVASKLDELFRNQ